MFYVYIITNKKDGVLYIGHTDDIPHRVDQHELGVSDGFSKKYNLKRLVYYEAYESREEAFTRERRMKKWKRAWKIKLIEEKNPKWADLRRDFSWLP